jgi:hypothetical protein
MRMGRARGAWVLLLLVSAVGLLLHVVEAHNHDTASAIVDPGRADEADVADHGAASSSLDALTACLGVAVALLTLRAGQRWVTAKGLASMNASWAFSWRCPGSARPPNGLADLCSWRL